MSDGASLRRVLAGYLRLRSPFNMVIDAVALWMVAAVLGLVHESLRQGMYGAFGVGAPPPPEYATWLAVEALGTVYGFVYWTSFGLFIFACARVVADRVAARMSHAGDSGVSDGT